MRRSRITGRPKPNDTEFGWYFAGEPMDKRHTRGGRIRLVRYGPEMETCAHSRCPSPSIPEKAPCSCSSYSKRCELHPRGTRSSSPSNTDSSSYGAAKRCCGGCHAARCESGSPPQVEKEKCCCNNRCEHHSHETRPMTPSSSEHSSSESGTKRYGGRHPTRRGRPSDDTRPTTPNSSDVSDYEPPRRRPGGRRNTKREPEHQQQVETCKCEAHAPPPNTPTMPGQRYNPQRATGPPRLDPIIQPHRCRKASYCERHPELCLALIHAPPPAPRLTPIPTRFPRPSENPRHNLRVKPDPKCTCKQPALPPKQVTPRPDVQHCSCFVDGYYADDSGYYTPHDHGTTSETSIRAMPDHDRDVDEARCILYHRCRPRYERGVGWVCGRK